MPVRSPRGRRSRGRSDRAAYPFRRRACRGQALHPVPIVRITLTGTDASTSGSGRDGSHAPGRGLAGQPALTG